MLFRSNLDAGYKASMDEVIRRVRNNLRNPEDLDRVYPIHSRFPGPLAFADEWKRNSEAPLGVVARLGVDFLRSDQYISCFVNESRLSTDLIGKTFASSKDIAKFFYVETRCKLRQEYVRALQNLEDGMVSLSPNQKRLMFSMVLNIFEADHFKDPNTYFFLGGDLLY